MFDKLKLNSKNDNAVVVLPNTNIYDQDKSIVLSLEMAGVDKESLDVNLEGNILRIKATKKKEDIPREYQALYQERQVVEYKRSFELNAEVDREKIEAEYKDGVLKVFLCKAEKAQPKKIAIKV
ncbi:MAG: Hsp20/alpha crystallin family protein [Candidatus Omnitrophica bacterium]|nr:Hsp20/alpha crystallin family protein [Candidatus Omnitrophota bacterium]